MLSSTNSVTWLPLNVTAVSGTSMAIRVGDSLRLTGYPVGNTPSGSVYVTILNGSNVVASDITTADAPFDYCFQTSGTYSVQTTWNGTQTTAMTVVVETADFGNPLFSYVNNSLTWLVPGVGTNLTVDWDSSLDVTENPPPSTGGRSFQILPLASGTFCGVARLSPGGPILASGTVQAINCYSASTTGDSHVVSTNPDGSYLVQNSIVINALPPGGYAVVQIFIGGATFEDGTTTMILTAADFINGVATFDINWANPHSVCHHVYIYDAQGNLVGEMM